MGQTLVVIKKVLAPCGPRPRSCLDGPRGSRRFKQLPPGFAFRNRPDRHKSHSWLSVASQDDLVACLGPPHQLRQLSLGLAHGDPHLLPSRPPFRLNPLNGPLDGPRQHRDAIAGVPVRRPPGYCHSNNVSVSFLQKWPPPNANNQTKSSISALGSHLAHQG